MKHGLILLWALLAMPLQSAPAPKVVVQLGHQAPVAATLWTQGSRFLVSVATDGSIVVWDTTNGAVVDRTAVDLPSADDPRINTSEYDRANPWQVRGIAANPDGRSARIIVAVDAKRVKAGEQVAPVGFDLDLVTRKVTPAAGTVAAGGENWPLSPDGRWQPRPNHGSGVPGLFDLSDENIQFDEADCTAITLCRYGVNVYPAGKGPPVPPQARLTGIPRSYFVDADLAGDGTRLVRVEAIRRDTAAHIQLLDLGDGTGPAPFDTGAAYHRVTWADAGHYLLTSNGYVATDDLPEHANFPPALLVAASRHGTVRIPAHGLMAPLAETGHFVGAGSLDTGGFFRDSRSIVANGPFFVGGDGVGQPPWTQLYFFAPPRGAATLRRKSESGDNGWTPRSLPQLTAPAVTAIATSPDRNAIAVAAATQAGAVWQLKLLITGPAPGAPTRQLWSGSAPVGPEWGQQPVVNWLAFAPDGSRLMFGTGGQLTIVDVAGVRPVKQLPFASARLVTDGTRVFGLDNRTLLSLATGTPVTAPFDIGPVVKAGFITGKPVLWAASNDGVVHFWYSGTGAPLLTLYTFADNRYFLVAPDGRYDTNLGPDTNSVRWLMPDAPFASLAAQTFMRSYYEPQLYRRTLACVAADSCAAAFAPLPPMNKLNRVLPVATIASVTPGSAPNTVDVCVDAHSVTDAHAPNGKTVSGLHDLRLFRDGRLVAERGAAPAGLDPADVAGWAKATAIPAQNCAKGAVPFTVAVPRTAKPVAFTAYAFNDDRVKGETSPSVAFTPAAAPHTPRAYVIAIGVNAYANIPSKSLNFAVNDAQAVSGALAKIPGYQVVNVPLIADAGHDSATKADIRAVLAVLGGDDRARDRLKAAGIDASGLATATPDDAVIVSFSGHGYADARGNFYLLPSDSRMTGETVDLPTTISSAELTDWLRPVDAGEMAMIIDACHSAASVAAGGFKPGPMGDPGLGQLAFDKGIRILAATQSSDVALEDKRLGQGLLTYALVHDGLGPNGADRIGNAVKLDALLRFAVARMPGLAVEAQAARATPADSGLELVSRSTAPPPAQQPALFDFTGTVSPVAVPATVSH